MDRIVLVDGNNLLFRSYYATAYNGNFMKNSKGFPTNALFGFNNMINKIILEEKPTYMIVAFDKGKTFRHDKFEVYKGKRIEMPDELKQQFPIAKELLTYMGIKYLTSGPEARAKLKVQLIGVVVAGLVIFGAYYIWDFVVGVGEKL